VIKKKTFFTALTYVLSQIIVRYGKDRTVSKALDVRPCGFGREKAEARF
jgi:hypothetical protein